MRLLTRRKTPTEELKAVAIEALINALDDDRQAAKPKATGMRALAAGALIYTAGYAAYKGQRFAREQLASDTEDDQPEDEEYEVDEDEDEPEAYDEDEGPEEDEDTGGESLKLPKQRRARIPVSKH